MLISVLDAQKTPNDYEYLRVLKPKVNEYAFCGLNPPPISLVLSYGHRAVKLPDSDTLARCVRCGASVYVAAFTATKLQSPLPDDRASG